MDVARLLRLIALRLTAIGALLVVEGAGGQALHLRAERAAGGACRRGALLGLLIGLVSSLLGVAGGELMISTLSFVFGLDIRAAAGRRSCPSCRPTR
jgi:hypothetical protein